MIKTKDDEKELQEGDPKVRVAARNALHHRLLRVTEHGRASDWNERIASLVRRTDKLKVEDLNLCQSPSTVAMEVVTVMGARWNLFNLHNILEEEESRPNQWLGLVQRIDQLVALAIQLRSECVELMQKQDGVLAANSSRVERQ